MKFISKLALAALALLAVNKAGAQTIIDITGSTAFRSAVHNSLVAQFNGTTGAGYAYTGTDVTKANQALFKGRLSGVDFIVRTSFNGSVTGIQKVASGATDVAFIPTNATAASTGTANATASTTGAARFALSDVYQSSTPYKTPSLTNNNVAVAPFRFLASNGAPITNMTPQLYRALYANATMPLSLFTGNPADTTPVYCTGRDNGSGTRATVMAETGYGINTLVVQYYATLTNAGAAGATINAVDFVPTSGGPATLTLDAVNAGNGGYTSGGDVAKAVSAASAANVTIDGSASGGPVVLVGYAGTSDANTALTNPVPAVALNYNGVAYSVAGVQNGTYTLWGYEHLYSSSGLSANETIWYNSFKTTLSSNLGITGIAIGTMNVNRSTDGAVVGP